MSRYSTHTTEHTYDNTTTRNTVAHIHTYTNTHTHVRWDYTPAHVGIAFSYVLLHTQRENFIIVTVSTCTRMHTKCARTCTQTHRTCTLTQTRRFTSYTYRRAQTYWHSFFFRPDIRSSLNQRRNTSCRMELMGNRNESKRDRRRRRRKTERKENDENHCREYERERKRWWMMMRGQVGETTCELRVRCARLLQHPHLHPTSETNIRLEEGKLRTGELHDKMTTT